MREQPDLDREDAVSRGAKVFISYAHEGDCGRAKALERALQRFAKPWYRRRSVHVFRDASSLGAEPNLTGSIQAALNSAQYLILVASAHAQKSTWVNREVEYWLQRHDGATLMAPLFGCSKDDLFGEDLRQHRRALLAAFTAAIGLLVLTIMAFLFAFGERRERRRAEILNESLRYSQTSTYGNTQILDRILAPQGSEGSSLETRREQMDSLIAHRDAEARLASAMLRVNDPVILDQASKDRSRELEWIRSQLLTVEQGGVPPHPDIALSRALQYVTAGAIRYVWLQDVTSTEGHPEAVRVLQRCRELLEAGEPSSAMSSDQRKLLRDVQNELFELL